MFNHLETFLLLNRKQFGKEVLFIILYILLERD